MATQNGAPNLERFRDYLRVLARVRIPLRLQSKVDASGIVQETMLEALRDWGEFRGKVDAELMAWLRRILAHNLDDALKAVECDKRDARRERSLEAELEATTGRLIDWVCSPVSSPSRRASREELALKMAAALARLDDPQRDAVELHYLQGLSLKEMSAQMDRSESAVASLLHRGKDRLRKFLEGSE